MFVFYNKMNEQLWTASCWSFNPAVFIFHRVESCLHEDIYVYVTFGLWLFLVSASFLLLNLTLNEISLQPHSPDGVLSLINTHRCSDEDHRNILRPSSSPTSCSLLFRLHLTYSASHLNIGCSHKRLLETTRRSSKIL